MKIDLDLPKYEEAGRALANAGLVFESMTHPQGKSYVRERALDVPPEPPYAEVQEMPVNARAEAQMKDYRPGGEAYGNRNKRLPPQISKPEDQSKIKEFFRNFLMKANDAQIKIFKAVMESPTVETIKALLSIPFMPQMIKEAKEKEREKWANTSDRDFCREFTKNQKDFIDCLRDLHNAKNKEKQ